MRLLPLFALALAIVPASAGAGAWKTVVPLPGQRPAVVSSDGVTVTLTPPTQAQLDAAEEGPPPSVAIVVQYPGQPPYAVTRDDYRNDMHGITVGIGALHKGDPPVVVLKGYSGGMHCCATYQMVTLADGGPRTLQLTGMDGAPGRGFPKDLDGDGAADVLRADDRFLYAFTSYNASWSPPVVYNLRGGQLLDVSAEPCFAKAFTRFANQTRRTCASRDVGRNGACSAYAAAMARLGKAEEGVAFAVAHHEDSGWLPEPCRVEPDEDGACPEGKARTFGGFEEALRWFLQDTGYTG